MNIYVKITVNNQWDMFDIFNWCILKDKIKEINKGDKKFNWVKIIRNNEYEWINL
jgi:hypothetical protein